MKQNKFLVMTFLLLCVVGCAAPDHMESSKFSGTLEITEYSLGTNASGRLATLNVNEGAEVKKGQLLATLERYDQAAKDYERLQQLQLSGGASSQDVEHAALLVQDLKVVSPVDGVVLVKVREVGETVAAGSPTIVVGDKADLWIKIYVPEGMINRVSLDQSANIHFDGIKDNFHGHVSYIAPVAEFTPRNIQTPEERVNQTFAVKIKLNEPQVSLRPGVGADVFLNSEN